MQPLRARVSPPSWIRSLLAVLLCAWCCASCSKSGRQPVHGWWEERGPVIPHDTFPANCSLCHVGGDWTTLRDDFTFDHEAQAGLALVGAHASAQCLRCHNDRGPVEIFAARGCMGCHEDVHLAQLGTNCADCHGERDWRPEGVIAMHAASRFPLVGAHAAVACWRCHPGAEVGRFTPTDTECATCHTDDLQRATSPDHLAQGWTQDCDRCHIPTTWDGAGFNHAIFPLTGAHRAAACEACHPGEVFGGQPHECIGCHESEYQSAENHVALGFPEACQRCHSTASWEGAHMDHSWIHDSCVTCHLQEYQDANDPDHAGLGIPLECELCHATNDWHNAHMDHSWVTDSCVACHLADYQNADDPDHVALDLPTDCELCHNTQDWNDAQMDHSGITDSCVTCHLDDYQNTNDPDHQAAGFPLDCEACHNSTTDWHDAQFDHDFPIDSGAHKNLSCAECHNDPNNYVVFTCIDCHAHEKNDMDDEHNDVGGYSYNSQACYNCHPDGKE